MAEPRFERDLRTMLARDLDAIHGPHGRWADSPAARRIERSASLAGRWPVLAVLAAAALVVLGVVAVLGSRPGPVPAPTPTPSVIPTPSASPSAAAAGCPVLADYLALIAAPSPTPAPPSFAPVPSDTKPTVGALGLGQVGVLAAPDGSPGALFRVSNPRFCDRLPDHRIEDYTLTALPGDYRLLLVDVEFTVLKANTLGPFIPGQTVVTVVSRPGFSNAYPVPYDFPGSDRDTSLDPSAGFSYRGTMSWVVPGAGTSSRIAVDVGSTDTVAFEYLIQDGSTEPLTGRPPQTVAPGATASTGTAPLDTWAMISADGALMPVRVGGVQVVDGYPHVMPSRAGDMILEVLDQFGVPSGPLTIDAGAWVLVGPDGHDIPRLTDPGTSDAPLLPGFAQPWTQPQQHIDPAERFMFPMFIVAEVPPTGRITLEYRPHGGPAQVSWVVRDH